MIDMMAEGLVAMMQVIMIDTIALMICIMLEVVIQVVVEEVSWNKIFYGFAVLKLDLY